MLNQLLVIIKNATITLPVLEVTVLLAVLTCCMVFRFTRIGLLTAYLFTYRWGWLFFIGQSQKFLVAYLLFGSIVAILTVIGMLQSPGGD